MRPRRLSGEMYELYAIAAAVIGGVSLMGGEGRVVGTMIGALIMGTLRNGLNALNVPSALEGMVVGGVLVAAVVLDRARHRRSEGRPREGWRRSAKWVIAVVGSIALIAAAFGYRARSAVPEEAELLTVAFVPKALNSPFWAAMEDGGAPRGGSPGRPSRVAGRRSRDRCRTPVPDHREPDPAGGGCHPARALRVQGAGAGDPQGQ